MRVLMLAQFYPPNMGGEEQHVRTLSRALAQRGHQVAVATLWHEGLSEFEMDQGVRVYRIRSTMRRASFLYSDAARFHATPFPDPETMWGLRRVVAEERPEIVHAHNWLLHSFLPLKEWSKARLVVTLHDYSLVCAQKRLMYMDETVCSGPGSRCIACSMKHYGPVKGLITVAGNSGMGIAERRLVDLFLAVSRATAVGNGLVGSGLPYRVIPNFLLEEEDEAGLDVRPYLAQLPERDFLLFVGDVVPDKGVGTLLEAYAGIDNRPPLVLIGRKTERSPSELPAGAVMVGSWPHAAVMAAWKRALAGIQPSQVPETFGIAILEAMSQGRAVIASRIGGLPDFVTDEESGLLVPPGDAPALRTALERLIDDRALRQRLEKAASDRAGMFSAAAVVPHVEEAYQMVCRARSESVPAVAEALKLTSTHSRKPD